ncbi:MAG: carbamate kinase [Desulfobacterales bacterium]
MSPGQPKEILLLALGGNALIRKGQIGTADEQFENLRVPIRQIARLSATYRIVITHGNGPQVGHLMLQQECCGQVPKMPLEILVAQTQGQIGYMIESSLDAALMDLGIHFKQRIVSLISYVVVDENDPAFDQPAKPIGPVLTEEQVAAAGYPVKKTAKGYRRVVVSPKPVTIVEKREIRTLLANDFIVVCCGGGGIPVVREERRFAGVDAVIDKDLASAQLAREVGVDQFLIATDVPGVALNYSSAQERFLSKMTVREAQRYLAEGHFSAGSMEPKVASAVSFVRGGGRRAIITAITEIEGALAGRAGTEIVPD